MAEQLYYWIDMEDEELVLYEGQYDEDGEKNRDSEDAVLWCRYSEIGVNPHPETDEELAGNWNKIDEYIESQLDYVPEYEVG